MGVGSAYLNLQSYGLTVFGFVLVVGGGLGLAYFNTTNGKIFGGIVAVIGVGMMWAASKIRKEVKTAKMEGSGGFEGVGKVFLGLAVLGAISKAVGAASAKSPVPDNLGGPDYEYKRPQKEEEETDETNSTNGNGE